MAYAVDTKVPIEQTRTEIERTLVRYKASEFAFAVAKNRASILFHMNDRRVRFDLALPEGEDARIQKRRRSLWRALLLCIKAKLESVDSGIETWEDAFLAHIVTPDGRTFSEHARPALASAYETGTMPPLLAAPRKGSD